MWGLALLRTSEGHDRVDSSLMKASEAVNRPASRQTSHAYSTTVVSGARPSRHTWERRQLSPGRGTGWTAGCNLYTATTFPRQATLPPEHPALYLHCTQYTLLHDVTALAPPANFLQAMCRVPWEQDGCWTLTDVLYLGVTQVSVHLRTGAIRADNSSELRLSSHDVGGFTVGIYCGICYNNEGTKSCS